MLGLNKDKSTLLVKLGHEIKTPLNTVIGYAQLLNGLDNLSPVAREYCTTILENEYLLLHLLNDLFELSKYETEQSVVIKSETNIKNLINEAVAPFIDIYQNKLLSLDIEFEESLPDILLVDAPKIAHIVSNLLGNALRFTRRGGVTIKVAYKDQLSIDVEDTGVGIDSVKDFKIYDAFNKKESLLENLNATGLGLAVARLFARMHEGDIFLVSSSIDLGSHFKVVLNAPVVETKNKKSLSIADYLSITGIDKPCKVLLVDDVDINLAMLEIFLAPTGFTVSIANSGEEAISLFKTFEPDIVFMDLIMPGKDGFEATKEIKALNTSVPIIALTASIDDQVKEQALSAGVDDFMNKPFIPERFFEIISKHTGIGYLMK